MNKILLKNIMVIALLLHMGSPAAFGKNNDAASEVNRIERSMLAGGTYKEAITDLEKILESTQDKARVYMVMGLAHYGSMEYESAYEYFKKSEEMGTKREYKELLSYAISKTEENRDVLAGIEYANNELDKDKETYAEKIAAGHLMMLDSLMENKYYYPAVFLPHLNWLKDNVPELTGLYKLAAEVYYSAMFYAEAVDNYEKAVLEDPENAELYKVLADCCVATGDFDKADENYEKAINLYREEGGESAVQKAIRLNRIRHAIPQKYEDIADLIEKKRFREAEDICKRRISLKSGDYVAITQLGQIYWELGKKKKAIKLFRKVVKIVPDYPTAHLFLGRAYFFERKPEKGFVEFDVYKEKMELLPEMGEKVVDSYVSGLHYICYMYASQKRYKEAIRECKKIIKLKPEDQRAHYNLAICYYVRYNKRSQAYTELKKVIEIDEYTELADMAKYRIDYMRRNPDARIIGDFSFIDEE